MLKTFRKKGVRKKILWAITVVIILSFGFFGNAYIMQNKQESSLHAGKVFGRVVSREEFSERLQETRILNQMKYGEKFYKLQQYLNLEGETWDRIILLEEAKKARIKVSDDEIIQAIQNAPDFQTSGRFDNKLYQYIIRSNLQIPPRNFEEIIRDKIKISHLIEKETPIITVSDDEVLASYKSKNEKVQVSYMLFSSDNYKDQVSFDETQAKDYYLSHKDDFLSPATVNVEYLVINKTADKKSSEEKASSPSSEKPAETSKEIAENLAEKMNKGADIAQLAKENNLVIQESGFFSMEKPDLKTGWSYPLIQKIFEMETGKILGPVETDKSWQVLRIKEKKDTFIADYNEDKEKVKDVWAKNEAKKIAKERAEQTLKTILEKTEGLRQPDFAKIAKELNLKIEQTPLFTKGQYLPTIGLSKDFQDVAFALKDNNKISGVVETSKGYCILNLDTTIPVDLEEFKKQQEQVKKTLLEEKSIAAFNDYLTRLRIKANLEDNIAKLKAKQKNY